MDVVGLYNTTSTFAQSGTDYLQHASHALLAGVDVLLATLHAALSMLGDPWVLEPFRYLLFSAIFEAVRRSWYTLQTKIVQSLFVEVRVDNGDFVWDWLDDYLTAHNVWGHATSYRLVSVPAAGRHPGSQRAAKEHTADDSGHPFPVYQSTPEQAEFWKWRGWWIKVFKQPGVYDYKTGEEVGGWIILSVYAWNRRVIDQLVSAARKHYLESSRPRLTEYLSSKAPSVLTATFVQPDQAYDWMLSFLASLNAWRDIRDIHVSAKRSVSTQWGMEDAGSDGRLRPMTYMPAAGCPQLLKWRGHWLQVTREKGAPHWRTGREEGGVIVVVLHHADRKVLDELIEAAREHQSHSTQHHVTIHLPNQYGDWAQMVKKARRPLESVILPDGVADMLLADAREFFASEAWYRAAGVPWRRGYLLHGVPGSGKSSTIHALASELMLPIYAISLAAKGLDDAGLQALVADTPPECILTLEDVDCAFPTRRDGQEQEREPGPGPGPQGDAGASGPPQGAPKTTESSVTLSGLLNVIDGVWSEEGRLVIATTNHIENLDPALVRPGRLDVKVEYSASTRDQAAQMYKRFFPPKEYAPRPDTDEKSAVPLDNARLAELAAQFADALPDKTFSAAALQGYLLRWKHDPAGAVEGVRDFVAQHEKEQSAREEANGAARSQGGHDSAEISDPAPDSEVPAKDTEVVS